MIEGGRMNASKDYLMNWIKADLSIKLHYLDYDKASNLEAIAEIIIIEKYAESGVDHGVKLKHTERGMVQKVLLSTNDERKIFCCCISQTSKMLKYVYICF